MPEGEGFTCEMWIEGQLDEESWAWFDDAEIEVGRRADQACTRLRFAGRDEAAVYGMIGRARDLGLTLVSFRSVRG